MTPREYIKWRCPFCNGYPAVRESRRDRVTEFRDRQQTEFSQHSDLYGSSEESGTAAMKEALCYIAG